ncbi:glycosyltransferase family 4 protein [uncultured Aliiroseovarius sp.]|uniref:glycosyltransferase family 4 protein n=1 Tax=uncultured Aliiroseovarius sp. TaxID=1658783 RepID=UPI00261861F3|nr:glycosyltransferase family 4 protein [uncultured Aliiroseovarius sp.]
MKILIIQGGFGAGGAEKVVAMIAAHRAQFGDEVTIMGFDMPGGRSYFPYPETVRLLLPDRAKGSNPLARLRMIRRAIKATQPDVVLSFLTKVNVLSLAAAIGTGTPVVISERNNPRAQNAHPIWRHAQNLLVRRAACAVMQTERARADLPKSVQAAATVIPNPCAPNPDHAVQAKPNGKRLVAVGRLDKQKGFDVLLHAMAQITTALPDATLTIHGEGPERANLEALRDKLHLQDHVALPGSNPTPGAWLSDADLLVMPSRFEGFPNVLAEATVSGLPAISTDCDFGPREMIVEGENGLLVPVDDAPALADAVIHVMQDQALRAHMAGNAAINRDRLAPARILAEWDQVIGNAARA